LLPLPFCFFSSCNATKKATFAAQNGCMGLVFVVLLYEHDDSNVVTFLYGGGVMEKAMVEGGFLFPLIF
jgi:hypothetical protein